MRPLNSGLFAAGLAFAVSGPAWAELTLEQAREAIFGLYDFAGYEITIGNEQMSGGAITLSDVSAIFPLPDGAGSVTLEMGTVTLSKIDDSVEVSYADSMLLTIDISPPGEDIAKAVGVISLADFTTLMSGSPDVLRMRSGATAIGFRLDSLMVEGQDIPLNFSVDTSEMTTDYTLTGTDPARRRFEGSSNLGSVAIRANGVKPGGGGGFTGEMTYEALGGSFLFDMAAVDLANPEDALRLLQEDFAVEMKLTSGSSAIKIDFADGNDRFAMESSSAGGRFGYGVSKQGVNIDIAQTDVALTFSSSEIPLPAISLAYEEVGFGLDVPLAAAGDAQDFSISAALRNLTVDDTIWAMFDPGQALPRDPMTVALALSGKVMVLVDLLDPETMMQMGDMKGPPILPVSASLDELLVSFGGARLTGSGAATLDLASAKVVNGIPMPVGKVDLKLTGAFGLMDTLANMGLIPPDASMMARGIIGAFARPVGEDDFESTLEITPDGAIMANGQRIQ